MLNRRRLLGGALAALTAVIPLAGVAQAQPFAPPDRDRGPDRGPPGPGPDRGPPGRGPNRPPPPPPPRPEGRRSRQPSRFHVWRPGFWAWRGRGYAWVPGQWVERRRGGRWEEGRWELRGNRWDWVEPRWR